MKNSGSYLTRAMLIALGSSAALSLPPRAHAQPATAFIFENFDNNPTGRVFPNISTISTTATFSGGYGVAGRYTSLGTAYNDAFTVVDGGLEFGALASAEGKKLRASGFNSGATATAIMIDGGRAAGDTTHGVYHYVYCSYLVNFSQISTLPSARAEVRIGGNSTSAFEMHMDGPASPASTTLAQPRLGYQLNNFRSAPSPATQGLSANTTYLMVGKFTEVGNFLGTSASYNYTSGSNALVLPSSATGFPGGLAIGHLIKGDASSGVPEDSIVTALVTSTEGGVTTRTVLINRNTTAASMNTAVDPPVPGPVALSSAPIAQDGSFTASARTTAGVSTLTNLPVGHGITAGCLVTHANLPPGTLAIGNPSSTTVTLSNPAITTASSNFTLTVRNINPIRCTSISSGSSTITVDRIPSYFDGGSVILDIKPGQLVEGQGIDPGTTVTGVNAATRVISLSKPTIATASNVAVRFYSSFAKADMWALTEAQYDNFISEGGMDSTLDAATIGSAANQVTLKISSFQSVGSWEFNQGKRFEVVAHGSSGSPQTFFLDEIRYGWNLRSVTRNTPYLTPPPSEPNTAGDDMDWNFTDLNDDGFGWKSGWYEVEETASNPGAFIMPSDTGELSPGKGRFLWINHRKEVTADQGTRRRPDPAVVDMSQPYTVKFLYKTHSGTTGTSFGHRIQIGADGPSGAGSNLGPNPGDSTNLTWLVGVVGGDDTGGGRIFSSNEAPTNGNAKEINLFGRPHWYFFDFDAANFIGTSSPNYFVPMNMQTSGVEYKDGNVYSFQIEVNPLTFTYKATVTDLTDNKTGTVANLKFRRQVPAHTLFWGRSKPEAQHDLIVGLDALRVSQGVPYVDPFLAWAADSDFGVPSGLQGRNADANGDGRPNFLHFALDGNPMSGARNAKEIHAITTIGSDKFYTLTIPVRTGATFSATTGPCISTQVDGITYRIQGSYDLSNWTTGPDVEPLDTPLTTSPTLSSGWEYKSFRLSTPISDQPKAFIRAVVDNAVSP